MSSAETGFAASGLAATEEVWPDDLDFVAKHVQDLAVHCLQELASASDHTPKTTELLVSSTDGTPQPCALKVSPSDGLTRLPSLEEAPTRVEDGADASGREILVAFTNFGGNPLPELPEKRWPVTAVLGEVQNELVSALKPSGKRPGMLFKDGVEMLTDMDCQLADVFGAESAGCITISVVALAPPPDLAGESPSISPDLWAKMIEEQIEHLKGRKRVDRDLQELHTLKLRPELRKRDYDLPDGIGGVKLLGKGGYGRVLEVQSKDGTKLAMKRQPLGCFDSSTIPFLREISILNALKGKPNIVQIIDTFPAKPNKIAEVWTMLEFFPGDLAQACEERQFNEAEVRDIMFEILRGLNSMHALDIVHRDLKPGNVLFDAGPPMRLALCDFGLSRSVHGFSSRMPQVPLKRQRPSVSGPVVRGLSASDIQPAPGPPALERAISVKVGTCCWRAPEMWGFADAGRMVKQDFKSLDIFALGLIWATLLTGIRVINHSDDHDPPEYLLLEILKKVDQPVESDLERLGFTADMSDFIRCVLADDMEAIKSKWEGWASDEKHKSEREEVIQSKAVNIGGWIAAARSFKSREPCDDPEALELITQATKFSYRERPSVMDMLQHAAFKEHCLRSPGWASEQYDAGKGAGLEDVEDLIATSVGRRDSFGQPPALERSISGPARKIARAVEEQMEMASEALE